MKSSIFPSVFQYIEWAFSQNEGARSILFRKYGSSIEHLSRLDELIGKLKGRNCANIIERVKGISTRNPQDCILLLDSFFSEITFASHFANHDLHVAFVLEKRNEKTPDLLCQSKGERFTVEVTSLAEDTIRATVLGFFRLLFNVMPRLQVCIQFELKKELSIPVVDKEERHRQNQVVMISIGEFMAQLRRNYPPAGPTAIDTRGILFSLEPMRTVKGYPGIMKSEVIEVPTRELQKRASSDLVIKAKKRPSFREHFKDLRYLIVYDCGESFLDGIDFEELLYGERISRLIRGKGCNGNLENEWHAIMESPGTNVPCWDRIEAAASDGWEDLLRRTYLIPSRYTSLWKPGIFLTCPAMDEVAAVIVRYKSGALEGYPNPFCRQNVNLHGRVPSYLANGMIQRTCEVRL